MARATLGSTCPLDCPGSCGLRITVEAGRVVRVAADPDHPPTNGVICGKVARYGQLHHGPRVETPLLRDGPKGSGRFRPIGWDEALSIAAERLRGIMDQYGPQAILTHHYGGTMGVVQRAAIERLTHRAGFSRQLKTLCYPIGFAGWKAGVGDALGPDPATMAESDCIVLWGINAASTHISLLPLIKAARGKGARLVVVDPYRNRTANLADHHIAPRPGSDGALAAAVMQVLLTEGLADRDYLARYTDFDDGVAEHLSRRTPEWAAPLTGLMPDEIRAFARAYGQARAPFIRIGLGMSRHNNGSVNIHAVSCLPAVAGAWRQPGGGALFATGGAFPVDDRGARGVAWLEGNPTRSLDHSRLGHSLTDAPLDPPAMGLLVQSANPAASCPNAARVRQGLAREDLFTVVHEIVMSDTAKLADLVFPATTFLEHPDLYKSFGQYTLQHAPALLPPRGEARSNHDFINALAREMGFREEPFTLSQEAMVERVLADSRLPPLAAWPEGRRWLSFAPEDGAGRFTDGFPQPDGRFHFRPGWSDAAMPPLPDHWPVNQRDGADGDRYPLDFMTPPAHEVLNTTFSGLPQVREKRGVPQLWIHPRDAAARGIAQDQRVVVFNDQARLTMTARVTEAVRPGLCLCEGARVADEFPEGVPLNALTRDRVTAPDGGAAFHDNRVEVALAENP